MTGEDNHLRVPATREVGSQYCDHDHQGDEAPDEVETHCCGGHCADDDGSDYESSGDDCEDPCCGHDEDNSIHKNSVEKTEPEGMPRVLACVQAF